MTDAPDPVPALKRQLAHALIDRFGSYNQFVIARHVRIDQPRASELLRGRIERFSLQQLVRFVARADGDINLAVTWTSHRIRIINPPRPRPVLPGTDLRKVGAVVRSTDAR